MTRIITSWYPGIADDLRRPAISGGWGDGGAEAPLRLIYVADIDKLVHYGRIKTIILLDRMELKFYCVYSRGHHTDEMQCLFHLAAGRWTGDSTYS